MRTTKFCGIFIILLVLFSMGVLAAVPAPGDLFSALYNFFHGLVVGTANIDDAYLITFILYLVIFLAIYMEGLQFVPIFGGKGHINKQGKIFAVAAAALSTLALFIIDQGSNVSTAERLSYLIAPFGIWGGLAIAGIVAFISYKLIRDSEVFSDQVMIAMAIAVSVGITFVGLLLGWENLVGWGFLIMLAAFAVGGIRAFTIYRSGTAEERTVKKKEKKKKFKESAEKSAKESQRKRLLEPVKGFLLKVENGADDLKDSLIKKSAAGLLEADVHLGVVKSNLYSAKRELKAARGKESGDNRTFINRLYAYVEAMEELVEVHVERKIPVSVGVPTYLSDVTGIKKRLNNLKQRCGVLIIGIDDFIDNGNTTAPAMPTGGGPSGVP